MKNFFLPPNKLIYFIVFLVLVLVGYPLYSSKFKGDDSKEKDSRVSFDGQVKKNSDDTSLSLDVSPDVVLDQDNVSTGSREDGASGESVVKSKYKNGTYKGVSYYDVPKNKTERIEVLLQLKDDVIVDVDYSATTSSKESSNYNSLFGSRYRSFVVGKNIDTVYLTNVAGASLTPIGFNKALEEIKKQALAE